MFDFDIFTTDKAIYEFRRGATGYSVDSKVTSKFGREPCRNQMFWSEDYNEARAFFNGIRAALSD